MNKLKSNYNEIKFFCSKSFRGGPGPPGYATGLLNSRYEGYIQQYQKSMTADFKKSDMHYLHMKTFFISFFQKFCPFCLKSKIENFKIYQKFEKNFAPYMFWGFIISTHLSKNFVSIGKFRLVFEIFTKTFIEKSKNH